MSHFELPIAFQQPKTSVWENYVPIIENTETKELLVHLTSPIDRPSEYSELYHRIKHAPADYTVHLIINTPGGDLDSALMIIDAINSSEARTIGHLSGTVASAGTVIALACNELIFGGYIQFMVHNYSTEVVGKGHEIKAYQQFVEKNLRNAFQTLYKGFLSDEEVESVIEGSDFYFNAQETEERWLRRKAILTEG